MYENVDNTRNITAVFWVVSRVEIYIIHHSDNNSMNNIANAVLENIK